jgi:hypothetical protein
MLPMIGAGILGLGSSILAGNEAKKGAKAAAEAAQRAEAMYKDIKTPSIEDQKLLLDRYLYEGNFSPEDLEALGLGPSAMENVAADQRALDAQVAALEGMKEVAEGGLTEGDLAAARQLQRQADSSDMARRKAVLNQMAQRGVLGSGMELAAQLQNTQDTAQSQADATDKLIQQAQARALEGLSRTGQLSEQMRYQSFNEGSQKAQAKDAINKFNTQNRQDVSNQNVSNLNAAQLRNLNARQGINNQNVDLGNQEQQFNKGLYQTQFGNQLRLADARSGRAIAEGQAQQGVSNARANQIGSIGSGLANTVGSIGGYMQQNEMQDKLFAHQNQLADRQNSARFGSSLLVPSVDDYFKK